MSTTVFSRPGVYVQENVVQQNITALSNRSDAIAAFIGNLPKGPVTPTVVRSWSEFVKIFGGLNYVYPTTVTAYLFFSNGGRDAYIRRTLGTGSASATAPITGMNSASPSVEVTALTATAINPGTWGNDLGLEVVNTDGRFSIAVYGKPLTATSGTRSNLLEQFNDLSITSTDSRYAIAYVNAFSSYIRLATTTAGVIPKSGEGLVAFTSGADGAAPVKAQFDSAYPQFDNIDTPLIFNLPDLAYWTTSTDASTALSALLTYAENRGDSFVVVDSHYEDTVADVTQFAVSVKNANSGANAAIYYPWLVIPDTSRSTPGVVTTAPPGGAVIGQYQATDIARGVFKTPAGYGNRVSVAVGLEKRLTNAELDTLNSAAAPVNALRVAPGSGIIIMGGRTMAATTPNRYINMRRSLIYVKKELTDRSQFAVFENNDEYLWNAIRTKLSAFLNQYWQAGGLRGVTPAEAFYVKCDRTTNTDSDIANGRVNIEIGIALEYPAEFVVITIGQISGSAAVVQG